jgi:diacylglycerol kinase
MKKRGYIAARMNSFKCAIEGFGAFIQAEFNARFHVAAAIAILIAAYAYQVSRLEWCVLILCIGGVLCTELINTAIENLCDHVTPALHPQIKVIKDIAAAAVLVMAICALAIAVLVFYAYVMG